MSRYRRPTKPAPGSTQINWSHPLAQGLVGCWLFNEGAGTPHNLARPVPLTATGETTWDTRPIVGRVMTLDGSTQYMTVPLTYAGDGDYSVVASFALEATTTNYPSVSAMAAAQRWTLRFVLTTAQIQFLDYLVTTDCNGGTINGPVFLTLGQFYQVIATQTGTALRLYNDTLLQDSKTALGTPGSLTGDHYLGSVGAFQLFPGTYDHVYWYSRGLDTDAVEWLQSEPYSFLRPVVRRHYHIPTSGAKPWLYYARQRVA